MSETGSTPGSVDEVPGEDGRHRVRLTPSDPDEILPGKPPPLRRLLVATDLTMVFFGWAITVLVARSFAPGQLSPAVATMQALVIVGSAGFLISANGLYRRRICSIRSAEVARIGTTTLALMVGALLLLLTSGQPTAAAGTASLVGGFVWLLLLLTERGLFREWIHGRRATGDYGAPIVVVSGTMDSAIRAAEFLADNPYLGFAVSGLVCPPAAERDPRFPWLGEQGHLLATMESSRATGAMLDGTSLTGAELNDAVEQLTGSGYHVHISSGLRGVDRRRITLAPLADETFLHVSPLGLTRRQQVTKRVTDVVLGGLALAAFAPALLISAAIVWLYDRGPVLYRQRRVGLSGEEFTLYKLRTMVVDADQRVADLRSENGRTGPLFKLARDPRVTPFGRFLRASSIDEVPQLFNVLEGTMSLVGPRPALPDEVAQFDESLHARMTVKPGLTGLWQVEARDLPNFDLYRRYDLLYVRNWSLSLDLSIIARTVTVVGVRAVTALVPSRFKRATVLE